MENEIRSRFLKVEFDRYAGALHSFVDFTYLLDVFLDKSYMKVRWIGRRRGVTEITETEFEPAIAHLNAAVEKDPGYSAAWKLLARALTEHGRTDEALAAYRKGIEVAQGKGDRQAAKEMTVFARRLEKAIASGKATGA